MNGAESLLQTLADGGVEVCFANPGTTEMPFVTAFDRTKGLRAILGLFEGVCTGAADGYARMAGKPAATLLHLGPGMANGLANLHNARRARSSVINLIGDHPTWHLEADAPLTSDIVSLASPVSDWVRTNESAATLAADGAAALEASLVPPGQVATLIVPHDSQLEAADRPAPPPARPTAPPVEEAAVATAAGALRSDGEAVLLIGGPALGERGLMAAARTAEAVGCRLIHETFAARIERGAGLPLVERLPYFPEQVLATLEGVSNIVLAGALSPVSFFGYPGLPSRLVPEGAVVSVLAEPRDDVEGALEALAEAVGAKSRPERLAVNAAGGSPSGPLDIENLGQVVATLQPEGAIVVDEAATSSLGHAVYSPTSRPHTTMTLTGGAIGQGMPCAVGAAIACPERRVIALQADGSGMYTLQALWTMARESLDVTVVLCANRSYRVLQFELARAGVAEPGPNAATLTDLTEPALDWVALAKGQGVPAVRVDTAETLAEELGRALAEPGPALIEALV